MPNRPTESTAAERLLLEADIAALHALDLKVTGRLPQREVQPLSAVFDYVRALGFEKIRDQDCPGAYVVPRGREPDYRQVTFQGRLRRSQFLIVLTQDQTGETANSCEVSVTRYALHDVLRLGNERECLGCKADAPNENLIAKLDAILKRKK